MPSNPSVKDKNSFDELVEIIRNHKLKLMVKYGRKVAKLWGEKW